MTIDELRAELQEHGAGRKRATEKLYALIPKARAAGVPVAEIRALTGLSRTGIYKILEREPEPD